MDSSRDFARDDGGGGRQNPGAVDVIRDSNDTMVGDFNMNKRRRRLLASIPKVDDDGGFAIHVARREAPRHWPAMVVGEVGRLGEGPGEAISHAEAGVGADEFTNPIPVLPIESLHVEAKQTRLLVVGGARLRRWPRQWRLRRRRQL